MLAGYRYMKAPETRAFMCETWIASLNMPADAQRLASIRFATRGYLRALPVVSRSAHGTRDLPLLPYLRAAMILVSAASGGAGLAGACGETTAMLDAARAQLSRDLGADFRGTDIRYHVTDAASSALFALRDVRTGPGNEEAVRFRTAFSACETASRALDNRHFEELFWLCMDEDRKLIEAGTNPCRHPLWYGNEEAETAHRPRFLRSLQDKGDDWDFWRWWYAALMGDEPPEITSLAAGIAVIGEPVWNAGEAPANREVRRLAERAGWSGE